MEIKNTVILIIVLILIGACAYYIGFLAAPKPAPQQEQKQQVQQPVITIEDKKITDSTAPFNIDITYPFIAGQDDFNKKIENYVAGQIAGFKTYSLENDAAIKKVDPESYAKYPHTYDLNIGYEKGQIDENTISVVLNVYSFVGGAHGSEVFQAFNYDVKNKKDIALADLFSGQADYLQKISDYCKQDLTTQINARSEGNPDTNWIERGTVPAPENYSVFLINKDNITFYFPQYQVAAYALGSFRVAMPK